MSTLCAQGTCLSLKINMNKPLSSFILSLQSASPTSPLQLAARCFLCAFCEAGPAMASFLPAESLWLGGCPAQGGISSHLRAAQEGHGAPGGVGGAASVTWRPSLSGSPARVASCAEQEPS